VAFTGSPDFTTIRKVTFTGDYNSVQMSGVQLAEFGLFSSGDGGNPFGVGSAWFREGFSPLTFDGTNELQITTTLEVLPG